MQATLIVEGRILQIAPNLISPRESTVIKNLVELVNFYQILTGFKIFYIPQNISNGWFRSSLIITTPFTVFLFRASSKFCVRSDYSRSMCVDFILVNKNGPEFSGFCDTRYNLSLGMGQYGCWRIILAIDFQ